MRRPPPLSEHARNWSLTPPPASAAAYEFSRKFPGYTAENLCEEGIHEVAQKRFVLVAADHPIISAISENADKLQVRNSIRLLRTLRNSILTLASPPLQMGEIAMMPEGLVK